MYRARGLAVISLQRETAHDNSLTRTVLLGVQQGNAEYGVGHRFESGRAHHFS